MAEQVAADDARGPSEQRHVMFRQGDATVARYKLLVGERDGIARTVDGDNGGDAV